LLVEITKYSDAESVIRNAINREGNITATLDTNDLICALSGVSWKRILTSDKCDRCDGRGKHESGYVCEYCGSTCGSDRKCKECKGTGKVNLRIKEFALSESRDSYGIKIGLLVYKANLLQTIAVAAKMLQAEQITYRYRKGAEAAVFSFAGIDILLTPYFREDASMEIKLNNV
jgi:RecJ-like exonuclease